ncbi:hypothetical protein [Salipiger bermudensis]|uniref:hypothetical protein n=1 Tax=Salipiger bermudensis TaxID=344736 RepID=UPI003AB8A98B
MIWPNRESHDQCRASMPTDPRWQEMDMPFDGRRMMWCSFKPSSKRASERWCRSCPTD